MSSDNLDDRLATAGGLELFADLLGRDRAAGRGFIGLQLGDYEITELIAEGGMGLVFRARRTDGSFDRDVAIKLSPISGLNHQLRERFLREQEVLAGLNHPGIIQLYDAGLTPEGWPYLVMELIDGAPIDAYRRRTQLDLDRIVDLIIETASAVASAHARLIVHRDIKPSNVMVTRDGRLKLLDFSIAKLLADQAGATTRANPMTPQFASPEQLLGREIGVGSDIYQLGMLLTVLLADETPASLPLEAAIERAARGDDTRLPAELRRRLPRDLQAVIEKATRAEPDARYLSATALLEDLRRFRGGYPVTARNAGPWYRAAKMARRNAAAVGTAAMAVIVLAASTVWYTSQLAASRDAARQAAVRAEDITEFMVGLFAQANPDRGGRADLLARELLDQAVGDVDQLATQPATRAAVLRTIGRVFLELGSVDQAASLFDQAMALQRDHLPAGHDELAETLFAQGILAYDRGSYATALEHYEQGSAILLENHSADSEAMIRPLHLIGNVHARLGNLDLAVSTMQDTLALQERYLDEFDPAIAVTLSGLGLVNMWQGNSADSEAYLRRALDHLEKAGATDRSDYPGTMDNLALLIGDQGRVEEAIELRRRALPMWQALYGEDHRFVAESLNRLGISENQLNGPAAAIPYFDQAIATFEASNDPAHPNIFTALMGRATARDELGDAEGAMADAEAALVHAARIYPPDHWRTGQFRAQLGPLFVKGGRIDRARSLVESGLEIILGSEMAGTLYEAIGLANLAEFHKLTGDHARAETLSAQALSVAEADQPDSEVVAGIREQLATLRALRSESP